MSPDLQELVLETAKTLSQPTVSQVIDALVKQKGLKFTDATQAVYLEWKKGTLNLAETNPSTKLTSYLFSLENAWFWATTGFIICSALVIFTAESPLFLYVRYVLGGVFIFLPGFMLISAIYPRGDDIDGIERIGLSIGLSLAILPIMALLLNYTPLGIRLESIVAVIAVLTEFLAVICVVKRFRYHVIGLK